MNHELLALRPDLPVSEIRELFHSFGVGAAPVLDEARHPIGVVSVRDVLEGDGVAADRMSRPPLCIESSTSVEEAARRLASTDKHHFIVVDGTGAAAGMLSTLDLLRGILGMPARHPASFPHWDEATSASWTDDWTLEPENVDHAPDGPGVLVLVRGGAGERDEIVWVESCVNTRARVLELTQLPMQQEPALTLLLALRGLTYRAAAVSSDEARARIVALIRDRLDHLPPPGGT